MRSVLTVEERPDLNVEKPVGVEGAMELAQKTPDVTDVVEPRPRHDRLRRPVGNRQALWIRQLEGQFRTSRIDVMCFRLALQKGEIDGLEVEAQHFPGPCPLRNAEGDDAVPAAHVEYRPAVESQAITSQEGHELVDGIDIVTRPPFRLLGEPACGRAVGAPEGEAVMGFSHRRTLSRPPGPAD